MHHTTQKTLQDTDISGWSRHLSGFEEGICSYLCRSEGGCCVCGEEWIAGASTKYHNSALLKMSDCTPSDVGLSYLLLHADLHSTDKNGYQLHHSFTELHLTCYVTLFYGFRHLTKIAWEFIHGTCINQLATNFLHDAAKATWIDSL